MKTVQTLLAAIVLLVLSLTVTQSRADTVTIDETSPITFWFVDNQRFVDQSSSLTAAQLAKMQGQFREDPPEASSALATGKHWGLFTIDNQRDKPVELLLYTFMQVTCTVHLVGQDGELKGAVTGGPTSVNHFTKGMLDEPREAKAKSRYTSFSIPAHTTYQALTECDANRWSADVSIFEMAAYLEASRGPLYFEGTLLGATVFMALIALFAAAINRDRTMLLYGLWLTLSSCELLVYFNDGTRLQEFFTEARIPQQYLVELPSYIFLWSGLLFLAFCVNGLDLSASMRRGLRLERWSLKTLSAGIWTLFVLLMIPVTLSIGRWVWVALGLEDWSVAGLGQHVWAFVTSGLGGTLFVVTLFLDLGLRLLMLAMAAWAFYRGQRTGQYVFIALVLYLVATPGLPLMTSHLPSIGSLDFPTLHLGLLVGLIYCLIGLVMAFAITVRNKEIKDAFEEQVRTRQAFMEEQNQVLEQRVKERTHELMLQTEKTERLMLNILPAPIAERLKRGEPGISDSHASVSILFSDLVGFTALSSKRSADEVVKLLNDLFSRFDIRAKSLGLEKIKTIGDAYMVAGGIPQADDRHAELVTTMALGMREDLRAFNEENGTDIAMRIGINSGSVIAGVIGHTKFSYDLWGNTVNAASRMESTCEIGQIQVSASTFELIKNLFTTRERGFVECKGLGPVKTFFVDQALQQL